MNLTLRALCLPTIALLLTVSAAPAFAQDAMAADPMATDAMAGDAMMSDEDMALCLEQAGAITFAGPMQAASDACHTAHNDAMSGDAMAADPMAPDAMAPDAMAPDAMAPAQ